jgi:hypothetical protein
MRDSNHNIYRGTYKKDCKKMQKEPKSTVIMRSTLEDSTKTQDKDLVNTTLRMEIDMKDSRVYNKYHGRGI